MRIDVVYGDDWAGMYVNDAMQHQGHSLSIHQIFTVMKAALDANPGSFTFEFHTADNEWLEDRGRLPEKLKQCKLEKDE